MRGQRCSGAVQQFPMEQEQREFGQSELEQSERMLERTERAGTKQGELDQNELEQSDLEQREPKQIMVWALGAHGRPCWAHRVDERGGGGEQKSSTYWC
jgi:hypothetical protein